MPYDNLLRVAEQHGIYTYEKPMERRNRGLYSNNVICINQLLPTKIDKACVLVEEIGHFHTSTGDILDQSSICNRKQEYRARKWAYEYLVPLSRIVAAGQAGLTGRHDIAEWMEVTEEFLQRSIDHYFSKYGLSTNYEEYTIYFDPLDVVCPKGETNNV